MLASQQADRKTSSTDGIARYTQNKTITNTGIQKPNIITLYIYN